ncbi:MAG TPA: hypothetical protein PKK06_06790 [Phycisphaerae bacterium]|nr:hypothetical protein [Phycisphaerae bacterium]HNU44447.1 hypothetical protein [Phycisphaerae bacterium]
MLEDVVYATVDMVPAADLAEFYRRQGHHTTNEPVKLERMMKHTLCFVTARRGGELIGIARGVTDGVWGRLAECKLDPGYQGPACVTRTDGRIEHDSAGIARAMAQRVIEALWAYGVERIDALAYGTEVDFCEELGFKRMPGVVPMQLATPGEGTKA